MRRFSLTTKINVMIALAVLIPLLLLSVLMVQSIRTLTLDNLQAFIEESGSRRQNAIENEIRASLNALNEFITANQSILIFSLEQQYQSGVDINIQQGIINDVQDRFEEQLIAETPYFDSVRMVTNQFFPYSTAVRDGASVPGSLRPQVEIGPIVEALDVEGGDTQGFGITNRDGVPRVEVVTVLLTVDQNGESSVLGYVLADLNLQEIFVDNLASEDTIFETYAYVILPETNDVIAGRDVLPLVDTSSVGAQRALDGLQNTSTYTVGDEENTRQVVGYSSRLTVDQENFAVVAELNANVIAGEIFQEVTSQVFVFVIAATAIVLIIVLLVANQMIVPPLRRIRIAILAMIRGDFNTEVIDIDREDEVGGLATSFVDMRQYIRDLTDDMQRQLQERNRDVQITQEISRAVANERDLNTLMSTVVDLIVRNYPDIYHAQIFLIDDDNRYAVLRASTGQAGRELLARGHKLGVGSVSVIGQVTEQGQLIVARDTAESNVHRSNEFLGDTLAELAIPLRSENRVIGALDVQSKLRETFDENQVSALTTLADQIAIAIENANLYAESRRLLRETRREGGRVTREVWQDYLNQNRQEDITISAGTRTEQIFDRLEQAVYLSGESIVGDVSSRNTVPFVVPVKLRDQVLGVVQYEVPKNEFSYDKVLLAEELVSRLAISLENARLFQTSQQSTERERLVNTISAKLTNQTEVDDILQTAVREIESALRTPQVAIRLLGKNALSGVKATGDSSSNGTNGKNGANGTYNTPNGTETNHTSQSSSDAE